MWGPESRFAGWSKRVFHVGKEGDLVWMAVLLNNLIYSSTIVSNSSGGKWKSTFSVCTAWKQME